MSGGSASAAPGQRLEALLRWLANDLGAAPGQCPSNSVIAARVGLPSYNQATSLLTRAERAGLLEFVSGRGHDRRIIRVLPAGLDLVRRRTPLPPPALRFAEWLEDASPGDRHRYFVGHLAEARGIPTAQRTVAMRLALDEAAAADRAAQAGLVLLTTQRQPDGQCAYLAIRRRRAA